MNPCFTQVQRPRVGRRELCMITTVIRLSRACEEASSLVSLGPLESVFAVRDKHAHLTEQDASGPA